MVQSVSSGNLKNEMDTKLIKRQDELGDLSKAISSLQEEMIKSIANIAGNAEAVLMASGELVGGQIEAVEQEPFYVLDGNGNWVEDPDHVTLLFTATTETPSGEVMTTKVGDQEVRIGKTDYILKSEFIEFSGGTIVDVSWEQE